MFSTFFLTEFKYNLRQPILYVFIIAFFAFTLFIMLKTGNVGLSGFWISNINNNAPYTITAIYATLSVFSLFVAITLATNTALRDYKYSFNEIIFSTGIVKKDYLLGRFLAIILISIIPYLFVLPAAVLAPYFANHDKFGSISLLPHLNCFLIFVIPNTIINCSVFYAIAITKKNLIFPFVSCVILLTIYSISIGIFSSIDNQYLINILDPLGVSATQLTTRFWTIAEKNSNMIYLEDGLLINRLLWVTFSITIVLYFFKRFSFSVHSKNIKNLKIALIENFKLKSLDIKNLKPIIKLDLRTYINQLINLSSLEIKFIIKSLGFRIIILIAILSLIIPAFLFSGDWYGTPSHPVTYKMIEVIRGTLSLMILFILLVYYSGEIMHKENEARFNGINDALPTPTWVFYVSKIITLNVVSFLVILTYMLCMLTVQLTHDIKFIELSVYFKELFLIEFSYFYIYIIIAVFFQIIVNHKYLGIALSLVFLYLMNNLGIEHNLLKFASTPVYIYSDFNGFGRFAEQIFHFRLFWILCCCMIFLFSLIYWKRENFTGLRHRLSAIKEQLTLKHILSFLIISLLIFIEGGYIIYNTNVLNSYKNEEEIFTRNSLYEKKYKKYKTVVQPKITDVKLKVDIFPYQNKVSVNGKYILVNKSNQKIDTLFVSTLPVNHDNGWQIKPLISQNTTLVYNDQNLGFKKYKFQNPLNPGDSILVEFNVSYQTKGFENEITYTKIASNGTFVALHDFAPYFGYNSRIELSDKNERKKFKLSPKKGLPDVYDTLNYTNSLYQNNADFVNYECTISTSDDQTAIAPGNLNKQWNVNNRNFYHYSFDVPVVNFFSFISGNYMIKRKKWKGIDLEVYYLLEHNYNVDRMIKTTKNTIEYCSKNFGKYPYNHSRVIEFPKFAKFAQAFPGTMPYSESIGFIADQTDSSDINMVSFVVSHETAHQWWGGMVVGADTKGVTVTSETLAQYVSLMVMEKEFGKENIGKFLKHELDKYLSKRGKAEKETSLILNDAQPFVHYNKGAIVMYNLKELVGEQKLNSALKSYFEKASYRANPYTTSIEFINHLKNELPDSVHQYIQSAFEEIHVFDNKTLSAKYQKQDNGQYLLNLEVEAHKYSADSVGNENEISLNDWIDVGVFSNIDNKEKLVYLKRVKITNNKLKLEILLDNKPSKAGIDPKFMLLDKRPKNNFVKTEKYN